MGEGHQNAGLSHKMRPWYADPSVGHFANDPSLTARELQTLVAWVDAGAPEGKPKDAPASNNLPKVGISASLMACIEYRKPFRYQPRGLSNTPT